MILIEKKMNKLYHFVSLADVFSKYLQHEKESNTHSYSEKKRNIENFRKHLTFDAIKSVKISKIIINEINDCINILIKHKNTYWTFLYLIN